MKKQSLKKFELKKVVISSINSREIIGGKPIISVSCNSDCDLCNTMR